MPIDAAVIRQTLDRTLAWSREQDYREYTKHDALNSPLVWAIFGHHRLTRILATQAVMRFPLNVRPLLGVTRSENPKGLALFAMALFDSYEAFGEEHYRIEAEHLLERLLMLRSPGDWRGACWGYQYAWQDLGFFAPKATPNAVVTAFVCEAFLRGYRVSGQPEYRRIVESASKFFLNDLTVLKETAAEWCLAYMPLAMQMRVLDVSILIAAVLAQLQAINGDERLAEHARKLTRYVVNRQTDEGAWFYTDPPDASPVKIDNYHTGFILDALDRVMTGLNSDEWRENHRRGAAFYAAHLFNAEGSPRWMSHQDYPHDIHGAAQGILTFSQPHHLQLHPGLAARVIAWALTRMYDREGRFYYQQTRFYTKKFTFLRWCNAWMCRALAFYLLQGRHEKS
ncbi:MAG: hypothetical protein H6975_10805 [Gammaproteobacteria bacterium]|nr:hypothetical protein [Gammaproteobacteria bacterium]